MNRGQQMGKFLNNILAFGKEDILRILDKTETLLGKYKRSEDEEKKIEKTNISSLLTLNRHELQLVEHYIKALLDIK